MIDQIMYTFVDVSEYNMGSIVFEFDTCEPIENTVRKMHEWMRSSHMEPCSYEYLLNYVKEHDFEFGDL